MDPTDVKRLKQLEQESPRLQKLVAAKVVIEIWRKHYPQEHSR